MSKNASLSMKVLPLSISLLVGGGTILYHSTAIAGGTINIGNDKSVTVGAGMRSSYSSVEKGAPSGDSRSSDFELDSVRLYVSGQVHKNIKMTFNTDRNADGDIRVIDGIAQFEFSDMLNIWAGRFLPPSDRSNFSGPYYLGTWQFPIAQAYPFVVAGRDDGIALWGQTGGGKFKYQIGAFQGSDGTGSANVDDNPLFAGRLTFNLWDPEPGYYNSSTYFGTKDIMAIGLAAMSQADASGTAVSPGDFMGWSIDALMEKKLGNGSAATLEAAYYDYDLDNKAWSGQYFGPAQGDGYFLLGGYLLPGGKYQPHARFESFETDSGNKTEKWSLGLTYVIDGHNARITGVFGETEVNNGDGVNFFQLGLQLQI